MLAQRSQIRTLCSDRARLFPRTTSCVCRLNPGGPALRDDEPVQDLVRAKQALAGAYAWARPPVGGGPSAPIDERAALWSSATKAAAQAAQQCGSTAAAPPART